MPDLIGYQNERYAKRYAEKVAEVARVEAERGAPGETAVAELYARNLYKLMAYKDEYEVARLHLLGPKPESSARSSTCCTRRCCARWASSTSCTARAGGSRPASGC